MQEHLDDWPPAPRRRIYLMRHGDVEYFDADGKPHRPETVPLTPQGVEQAHAAADLLAQVPLDRVLSSGLRRTDDTAALIAQRHGLAVLAEPRFREIEPGRMSDWAAVPPALVRQLILHGLGDHLTSESHFLGGETFACCRTRLLQAWNELLADTSWATVVLVAHGVVNRLLLSHCLELPLNRVGRLEQDAGCVNLIELSADGPPLVRMINFTPLDPIKQTLQMTTFETLYNQFLRGQRRP